MSWFFVSTLKQRLEAAKKKSEAEGIDFNDALDQINKDVMSMGGGQENPYKYIPMERPRLLEEGLPVPPEQAFWVAIVYMMVKQPKMLERLAAKFMDTQARIIGGLAQAGAGNIITAYSHSFLIGLMLEQNYMIRQRGADDLIASLNVLTTAQALTNLLQGFAVPEVITFAATGTPFRGKAWTSGAPEREKGK